MKSIQKFFTRTFSYLRPVFLNEFQIYRFATESNKFKLFKCVLVVQKIDNTDYFLYQQCLIKCRFLKHGYKNIKNALLVLCGVSNSI